MKYRSMLHAELLLYGDYGEHLTHRQWPGGEDRIDDLAQAWIDGDRTRVLAEVAAHESSVRARIRPTHSDVAKLRKERWSIPRIAKTLGLPRELVSRLVGKKHLGRMPTTDTARILSLRSQGLKLREIAAEMGVSLATVYRATRKAGSDTSATT